VARCEDEVSSVGEDGQDGGRGCSTRAVLWVLAMISCAVQ